MKKIFEKIKNLARKCWSKIKKLFAKAWKSIQDAAQWCLDHPESVYIISGAAAAGSAVYKKFFYKTAAQKELEYQRRHVWDASLGHHWTLRRDLTSTEMTEMTRRRQAGESYADILESMRVLA